MTTNSNHLDNAHAYLKGSCESRATVEVLMSIAESLATIAEHLTQPSIAEHPAA